MSKPEHPELQPDDFRQALRDLDSYIDVSVEDLMQINQMAQKHAQLRTAEQTKVSDIMTRKVVTVQPETPLREAARMLLEMRISGLPVVDGNDKLIGIVTEADFLGAMGVPIHHPAHSVWHTLETMFRQQPNTQVVPELVADIMAKQVITIAPDKTLHDAIDMMKKHHVKRLVVVDVAHKVLGIITRSNLVQVLLQKIL